MNRDRYHWWTTFAFIAVCLAGTWILAEPETPTLAPPRATLGEEVPAHEVLTSPYDGWESERNACDRLARKYDAITEVRLPDGCRVDMLSDAEAIEVDWAKKWPEAIGQSLYYSIETNRPAGVILLIRDAKHEARYIARCRKVCDRAKILLHIESARKIERKQWSATLGAENRSGECLLDSPSTSVNLCNMMVERGFATTTKPVKN